MEKSMERNSLEEVSLRRYNNILICTGTAVLLLGMWSVAKAFIQIFMHMDELKAMVNFITVQIIHTNGEYQQLDPVELGNMTLMIVLAVVIVCCAIDLAIRMLVGIPARKVGLKQKRKRMFLFWDIVLIVVNAISFLSSVASHSVYVRTDGLLEFILTLAIDATNLFVSIQLLIAAINVRKYSKLQEISCAAVE